MLDMSRNIIICTIIKKNKNILKIKMENQQALFGASLDCEGKYRLMNKQRSCLYGSKDSLLMRKNDVQNNLSFLTDC